MNEKPDLYERFKTMSVEDLGGYKLSAKIMSRGSAFFAISFILFAMFFTSLMTITAAFIACWFLGRLSVEVDNALRIVNELILKKAKADK